MRPEDHTRQLFEEGYTIFESLYDDQEIAAMRGEILRFHEELGSPCCYSATPRPVAPFVQAAPTGLVIAKLVERWPSFARFLIKEPVVAALRGYLGPSMFLELTAAVLADVHRVVFPWHTHIGGQDDTSLRNLGVWPTFDRPRRVGALAYLEDLTDDNGPLHLHPRALQAPTSPPGDPAELHWEGQVVVRAPRGSVVIMDECTWHTAEQKTSPGLRVIVGCNFASREAPPSPLVETSLRDHPGPPLFRSVVP